MLAVVKPSMPGMRTSIRIAAKSSSSTLRSASSPELAVTRRAPSVVRTSFIAMRLARSSSTIRMLAGRESLTARLLRQNQQRVAAQHAHGGVPAHPVQRVARPPEQLRFPPQPAQLGAAGRVEMVDHLVAAVLERGERGLLGEVMDVAHAPARVDQGVRAHHLLRR